MDRTPRRRGAGMDADSDNAGTVENVDVQADTRSDAERIRFDADRDLVELDLSHKRFSSFSDVTAFFAALDHRLGETGRLWFFLIRDDDHQIEPQVWVIWGEMARRTKRRFGLGTARYPDLDGFAETIGDPSRHADRDAALAAVAEMVAAEHAKGYRSRLRQRAEVRNAEAERRLTLFKSDDVAELDLDGLRFETPQAVETFFAAVDRRLGRTLQRWFLLIEAANCRIAPGALASFARCGRALADEHGLAAVRVMGAAAEAAHDPLVVGDRQAGFARIREIRRNAGLADA